MTKLSSYMTEIIEEIVRTSERYNYEDEKSLDKPIIEKLQITQKAAIRTLCQMKEILPQYNSGTIACRNSLISRFKNYMLQFLCTMQGFCGKFGAAFAIEIKRQIENLRSIFDEMETIEKFDFTKNEKASLQKAYFHEFEEKWNEFFWHTDLFELQNKIYEYAEMAFKRKEQWIAQQAAYQPLVKEINNYIEMNKLEAQTDEQD